MNSRNFIHASTHELWIRKQKNSDSTNIRVQYDSVKVHWECLSLPVLHSKLRPLRSSSSSPSRGNLPLQGFSRVAVRVAYSPDSIDSEGRRREDSARSSLSGHNSPTSCLWPIVSSLTVCILSITPCQYGYDSLRWRRIMCEGQWTRLALSCIDGYTLS